LSAGRGFGEPQGTLRLRPDAIGLLTEIDTPNTSAGRDTVESVRRGDVSGFSFGFRTLASDWFEDAGELVRVVKDMKLLEVSIVAFPAYPRAEVELAGLPVRVVDAQRRLAAVMARG
jgi:Escherichia/Staphylococcus phage prohead protease